MDKVANYLIDDYVNDIVELSIVKHVPGSEKISFENDLFYYDDQWDQPLNDLDRYIHVDLLYKTRFIIGAIFGRIMEVQYG